LKLFCRDHEHLMDVLLNTIQDLPNVSNTETLISLDQVFERQVWVKGKRPANTLSPGESDKKAARTRKKK